MFCIYEWVAMCIFMHRSILDGLQAISEGYYFTMLSNKKVANESQSLVLLRYASVRSKDQMTDMYLKNKCKLPPILQSREFLMHQIASPSPKVPSARQLCPPTDESIDIVGNFSTEIIPRIGKLLFDKDNPRKIRRDYLINFTDHHKGDPYKLRHTDTSKKDQRVKIFSKLKTCPSELIVQDQVIVRGSKGKRMGIKTEHYELDLETQRGLERSRSINIKEILQNFAKLKVQREGERLQLSQLKNLKKNPQKKRMRIISSIPLQPQDNHIIQQQILHQDIEPWSHSKDEEEILFR